MSTAGRANEVGSVFRCFSATHLAVHALRGRAIPGLDLPAGVHAVSLAFETSDPTDDLVVTMSDGRQAYVSAKRRLGRGAPLTDTVAGWAAQAASLDPDDLLVVACEELVGPLQHLDRVLRRRREGLALTSEDERSCLGVLSAALSGAVPTHQVPALIDRVRLLHLPGATTGSQGRDLLSALLDAVVPDGKGDRALAVLSDLFHRRAGEAHVSGVDEWVALLEEAGAPLGVRGRGNHAGIRGESTRTFGMSPPPRYSGGRRPRNDHLTPATSPGFRHAPPLGFRHQQAPCPKVDTSQARSSCACRRVSRSCQNSASVFSRTRVNGRP